MVVHPSLARAAEGPRPRPTWIWTDHTRDQSPIAFFRKAFDAPRRAVDSTLRVVGDFSRLSIYLNGQNVGEVEDYDAASAIDVSQHIRPGRNVIAVRAAGSPGPSAFAARLELTFDPQTRRTVDSDTTWLSSPSDERGWSEVAFAARGWTRAVAFGIVGDVLWADTSRSVAVQPVDDYGQWKQALGDAAATHPATFQVPPGYRVELLRAARPEEGSWVSLAFDPQGRLAIGKESKGILRLTLPERDGDPMRVETINDTLKECRGLLYAYGSLYANANESKGLFRLRDTDADDRFDEVKLLYHSGGGTGHGRNDLTLGPDGLIYSIHGDAVDLPALGTPDRTSPFREHRRGRRTREGHVVRLDRDGGHLEIVTRGLRNPYGIDFNADGEMFTYDADAEYDTGAPWYRPTRVQHLLPGGDYGWRGVTRSWPPYYPDQPDAAPPNLDIGKGSPTSVKFGYTSRFPPRYRRALFVLDWAYGRILAVHWTPRGASYVGRAETFLRGRPLNVTDLDFGPDGAMYFVTGGRKTRSALYRVRYVGPRVEDPPPTPQQRARARHASTARALRRRLEALHGRRDPRAVDIAWPALASPDPWLRHAARVAVEHQPRPTWAKRALREPRPRAALTALMALARDCDATVAAEITSRLNAMPLERFSTREMRAALRTYALCVSCLNGRNDRISATIRSRLDPFYPSTSLELNQALSTILIELDTPNVVPRTLPLLEAAANQAEQLHYLLRLRNVRQGWTRATREAYFRWLPRAEHFTGGEGMPTFIQRIKADALAALPKAERRRITTMLEAAPSRATDASLTAPPRPFVKAWTLDDLMSASSETPARGDPIRGQAVYAAALCARCHRLGDQGIAVGPDLTAVANRFNRRDLLDSILTPSKVIAEPYQTEMIRTVEGRVIVGRVIPNRDYRSSILQIEPNPLEPGEIVKIHKGRIESHATSPVSPMPEGLLDTLSRAEILDLLAYIESGARTVPTEVRFRSRR